MPTTTNYGWALPDVGADADTWGTELNAALDDVDTDLRAVSDDAAARLVKTSNLSDLTSAGTARANLGLGNAAVKATGTSGNNVPLLDGTNTWSGLQTLSGGGVNAPRAAPTASDVGFLGTPVVQVSASRNVVLTDFGKTLYVDNSWTLTLQPVGTIAYPVGFTFNIVRLGSCTLTQGAGVSLYSKAFGTGSKTVNNGVARVIHFAADQWIVTGDDIT